MSGKPFHWMISLLLLAAVPAARAAENDIVVIANESVTENSISAELLTDYYLKKKLEWPNGTPVRFVDRNSTSSERKIFLEKIVQMKPYALDNYWIGQKVYTGTRAPLQVTSDHSVLQFVSSFKGAIGYVSPTTKLSSKKIKVLKVIERAEED